MSSFEGILETIAGSEIRDKVQLADYLLNILGKIKNLHPEDRKALAEFADVQVDQEEYYEVVVIKALFLNHDYQ